VFAPRFRQTRFVTDYEDDDAIWERFAEQNEEQRRRRRASRDAFGTEVLPRLRKEHEVRELTPYQFRIDGKLDLYPTGHRWHLLRSGKRGGFQKFPPEKSISDIEGLLRKA
jgi:hypothetical protein